MHCKIAPFISAKLIVAVVEKQHNKNVTLMKHSFIDTTSGIV
ncbi:hypothetical protein [Clostridium sporogenes]|nr:hypothetical protein [Clostridium sporogenes]